MSRRLVISQQRAWAGAILSAVKTARTGDTIVVHSHAQCDFLNKELAEMGKLGVRTENTRRREAHCRPIDAQDSGEVAAKLYDWIQHQAEAARQHI